MSSYQRLPTDTEEKRYARVELQNIQITGEQPQYVPIAQNQLPAGYTEVQVVVPQPQVIVIPPTPTPEQLKATLRTRRVDFSTCKYLGEGWTFTRYNCCTIFLIMLTWVAIFVLVQVGSILIIRGATGPWDTETNDGPANFSAVPSFLYRISAHAHSHPWQRFDFGSQGSGSQESSSERSDSQESGWYGSDSANNSDYEEVMPENARIGLMILMVLQQILIFNPALASLFAATFKAMRDNARLKWKDGFMCFQCPYYRRLLPLTMILLLGRFVGFHLFVVPGILFSFVSMFSIPLHHQFRHLSGWQAIKHSFWVVKKHFCSLVGFVIVLGLINVAGFFLVLVGLLFTLPLTFFAFCYCYHHLVGVNGVAVMVPASLLSTAPPASPPSSPSPTTPTPAPHTIAHTTPAPIQAPTPIPTSAPSHFIPMASTAPQMYHPSAVIAVPAGPNTSSMTVAPAFYAPVYPTTHQGNIQGTDYPGQYSTPV